MKILYHHRIGSKDGQFVHVEELTRVLALLGHEIVMVGPAAAERESFGYDPRLIGHMKRWIPGAIYELLEYLYSLVDYRRLVKAVRRERPDCLYERYNLFLPTGVWLKRRYNLPMLLEVNAPLWEERSRYGGISLSRLARSTERKAWCGADYVLPVTEVLADHVRRAGVPDSRIVVIPNGINTRRFEGVPHAEEAKARLGLSGKLVLGFTGFAREWHGLGRLIDYLSTADKSDQHDLHVLIVGDGPAVKGLRARASDLGVVDRLTVTGIIDRDTIANHVAAFDVALQPAVVPYASPLKLFEYLILGKAVLAPDTPNIREVLTHERDALLFDPANPGTFETALARLCSDSELRENLGGHARRLVNERGYTWENNAHRVVELFRGLGVEDNVTVPAKVGGEAPSAGST